MSPSLEQVSSDARQFMCGLCFFLPRQRVKFDVDSTNCIRRKKHFRFSCGTVIIRPKCSETGD
jgi:hypothetical protein